MANIYLIPGWCTVIVLLTIGISVDSELFTAITQLQQVLHSENSLATNIRLYIKQEEQRLEQLQLIADDYEMHSKASLQKGSDYVANPVNAFLLVKRFTTDWYKVEELIRNNSAGDFLSRLQSTLTAFPDNEDLTGAATALLRLQDTYDLPTESLAMGHIEGAPHSTELADDDCFELGRIAYNGGDYYHTILWMDKAVELMRGMTPPNPNLALAIDYLAYASYMQGDIVGALDLTIKLLALDPTHIRAMNNKIHYENLLEEQEGGRRKGDEGDLPEQKTFTNSRQLDDYRSSTEFQRYEALCRGEQIFKIPQAHTLSCTYARPNGWHYWSLRPLKEEVVYHDPKIVYYHDVMTDDEIKAVKELAEPRMYTATTNNPRTGLAQASLVYRTAKSAWLKDEESPVIAKISDRVHKISGLELETAEELQVVNYGIGGHYEPHYDFARPGETPPDYHKLNGNRMATGLSYLSDVPRGGYTVFTDLGLIVKPEKGAMTFWYNLKRNGEGDLRTRHAGCPVLVGIKWVANKWIHERGQEFTDYNCDKNAPDL